MRKSCISSRAQEVGTMSFIIYDLIFFILCTALVAIFLYTHRHKLQREGWLYLYRTKVGLKIIDWSGRKHAAFLRPLQYVVVFSGYALMAAMLWFMGTFTYKYLVSPTFAEQLRVPILTPLVPYIDKLFPSEILPPFYFTYWIIIIAIIAIPHEFAHGIFARLNKVKIHSTGFGFLGPFLAAFVEQDEKDMKKAKKFPQLAILAAGTFANVLMTVLFGIILIGFILVFFVPIGVNFNTYPLAMINVSDIATLNTLPFSLSSPLIAEGTALVTLTTLQNRSYLIPPEILQQTLEEKHPQMVVYEDAPAVRAQLSGAITSIDGRPTTSYPALREVLESYAPGANITIVTRNNDGEQTYRLTLAEREGKAFLGIGITPMETKGLRGWLYATFSKVKDPYVYYESRLGEFRTFIYDLLWWIVLINLSVALVNMLPVGIFDGGRFFYLTVWGLTGSESIGQKAFKISTWILLALVALMMLKWVWVII